MKNQTPKIKSYFNREAPRTHGFATIGDSMTQQQFKEECDVNNILAKYKRTGLLSHVAKTQGNYGDFASVEDYQSAVHRVMRAEESFNLLPSEIRNRFANDPTQLIGYLADEKNRDEAIKLGLIIPPKIEPTLQQQMETALENNDKKRSQKPSKE